MVYTSLLVVCVVCVLCVLCVCVVVLFVFFFQAEDGIRDLVRSRGLGDVYKRQRLKQCFKLFAIQFLFMKGIGITVFQGVLIGIGCGYH